MPKNTLVFIKRFFPVSSLNKNRAHKASSLIIKEWAFHLVLVVFLLAPTMAASSAICQDILDGPALAEMPERVKEGKGAYISSHRYGEALDGINCSEDQIEKFMTGVGFKEGIREEWPEPIGPYFNKFNVRLTYCTPRSNWFIRKWKGDCGTIAFFYLLDGKISSISAAGNK